MTLPIPPARDARRFAPATGRNREPILSVLQAVLPPEGTVLEISSGTGEHAVFFAPQLRPRRWQTSEADPELCDSIEAWMKFSPSENLLSPILLDVRQVPWPIVGTPAAQPIDQMDQEEEITAVVNINMIHIAPWEACQGLMAGAEQILPSGGVLYLYGPHKRHGQHTAPSNTRFDQSLRSRNPAWGVRDLEHVVELAQCHRLVLSQIIEMPAHNLSVVFQKT
jgi:hypothetical protein